MTKRETAAERAARMKKTPAAYDRAPGQSDQPRPRGPKPATDEPMSTVTVPRSLRQRLKAIAVQREMRSGEREVLWKIVRDGLDALGEDAS